MYCIFPLELTNLSADEKLQLSEIRKMQNRMEIHFIRELNAVPEELTPPPFDEQAERTRRVALMRQLVADNVPMIEKKVGKKTRKEYDENILGSFLKGIDEQGKSLVDMI